MDCPIFCRMNSKVFVGDLALRYRWIIPVSHDVFLRQPIAIASNHNLVKILYSSSAEAMCIKQISSLTAREIKFFVLYPLPTAIFPCPACCFKWQSTHSRKAIGVLHSYTGDILLHLLSNDYFGLSEN